MLVTIIHLPEQPENIPVEMGIVIEIEGELVRVQPHQHTACTSCGSSQICFPENKPAPIIEANLSQKVNVGDLVELKHQVTPRLFAALIVFGLPVVTMLSGVLLGLNATGSESQGGIAGALAGLALGLLLVRFVNRLVKTNASLRPTVGSVLDPHTLTPIENSGD